MPFHQHHHEFGTRHPDFLFAHPIRAMYIGDTLRGFGVGLFSIFAPIYLFLVMQSADISLEPITGVFIYYAAYWMIAIVVMYNAVRIYPRFGFRTIIIVSFGALAAHIILLALAETQGAWLLIPALMLGAVHSGLFWPAYHLVFARAAEKGHRGQAVGTRSALMRIARLTSPLLGGYIIAQFGFVYVFAALLGFLLLSAIPYSTVDMHDGHRGGVRPIFREFQKRDGARAALAFSGVGALLPLAGYAWPILLFTIGITYEQLGLLATAASVVTIVTVYIFGKFSDHHDRAKLLKTGSSVYAGSWILRIASGGIWSAFGADALANMSGSVSIIPFESQAYDRIAKEDPHEQVHLVLLRELSINGGKVIGVIFIIALLLSGIDLRWIMALGIPSALLMPLIMGWGKQKQGVLD